MRNNQEGTDCENNYQLVSTASGAGMKGEVIMISHEGFLRPHFKQALGYLIFRNKKANL